jgi:hypothetical protein
MSWYVESFPSLDNFILEMLKIGTPIETSVVGVFDPKGKGRGSRQEMDLPLHRDGEYSKDLAEAQGGHYVDVPGGVDIVGLYCIQEGSGKCETLIKHDDNEVVPITLKRGQALVFDNRRVLHGRRGSVGNRILLRIWLKRKSE